MTGKLRKNVAIGVCAGAIMSQHVAFCGGSSPQDAVQLTDMEKMTSKEIEFAGNLTGPAVEAYNQMNHKERTMAMEMAQDNDKITSTDAVMMVLKKRPS